MPPGNPSSTGSTVSPGRMQSFTFGAPLSQIRNIIGRDIHVNWTDEVRGTELRFVINTVRAENGDLRTFVYIHRDGRNTFFALISWSSTSQFCWLYDSNTPRTRNEMFRNNGYGIYGAYFTKGFYWSLRDNFPCDLIRHDTPSLSPGSTPQVVGQLYLENGRPIFKYYPDQLDFGEGYLILGIIVISIP
ncbi:hypothetical protein AGABI1DRAFT_126398 [Agaricus bisporus var. burnettii JB137-S8]|uniref:Uncharacterized protein n=1 Tax=Agaricus bisporus var. burnettii (strain JB137-S8 / ATCC MYA-4627 / FGSC 10392) TaxID=597362 RepID=K5Y2G0_AGABU|nr:uncharacterized protein AGABI1DRAFT_126398 [Agaricus bisporus var. burnettii JB137-S8]EKM82050.1 hypothetical protein AGABI1DRAFT_126398 [Agaricus bisporus var. burnettii JB137-S8]